MREKKDKWDIVLDTIKANAGKTRGEIEEIAGMSHALVADCIRDLIITGRVVELPDKRKTKAGNERTVNVLYATYE